SPCTRAAARGGGSRPCTVERHRPRCGRPVVVIRVARATGGTCVEEVAMEPRIPALCLSLLLAPLPAFAAGVDLSVIACPGNAGASSDAGSLDCAGGELLQLLGVFQPNEAHPDLVGIDATVTLTTLGAITGPDDFWDFAGVNAVALSSTYVR